MKQTNLTNLLGKNIQAKWMDAVGGSRTQITELAKVRPSKHLAETITFGKLLSFDKKAICVLKEFNTELQGAETDFTVIPRSWIKSLKRLR